MTANSPPVLDYVSPRALEPRRHWRIAYRAVLWTYGVFAIFLIARYSLTHLRFLGRFGPINPVSRADRFAVDITQSQAVRFILIAFGLFACIGFRRAFLGLPYKKLLAAANVGTILTLLVRIWADIYVEWIAKIDLVASGRPYRFSEFWGSEFAIFDIILCLLVSLPLLVCAVIWFRDIRRGLDMHLRIETTPGVCGGVPCIAGTRIPVWVIEQARRHGLGEAEILRAYPRLNAGDLDAAWAYARANCDEIDGQIYENEAA